MDLTNIAPGRPLDRVHGTEYALLTPEQVRERSRQKLDEYLKRSVPGSRAAAGRIMADEITDRYVRARALRFTGGEQGLRGLVGTGEPEHFAPHALDQTAERAGVNVRYLHDLQAMGTPWANELAAHNLNQMLAHKDAEERYLVRAVDARVRGVLSASFKRIDSRPTLAALLEEGMRARAEVVGAIYTETRVSVKLVVAEPIEVFPGEWMVFGLDYSNSDYGDGARQFSSFLLRLLCLNGAVSVKELRKIHLGKRFSGDDGASARTLELDAKAEASFARDQVRALLAPKATDHLVDQIRKAASKEIAPEKIQGYLKTRVSKGDAERIVEKFGSADVVEVPPGQNAWRFSNAISWLARETEDARKKMDLERLAGEAMAIG